MIEAKIPMLFYLSPLALVQFALFSIAVHIAFWLPRMCVCSQVPIPHSHICVIRYVLWLTSYPRFWSKQYYHRIVAIRFLTLLHRFRNTLAAAFLHCTNYPISLNWQSIIFWCDVYVCVCRARRSLNGTARCGAARHDMAWHVVYDVGVFTGGRFQGVGVQSKRWNIINGRK